MEQRRIMHENPLFNHFDEAELSREALRKRIVQQIAAIYPSAGLNLKVVKEDYTKKLELLYGMADYDIAFAVRLLVHLVLYTDTVTNLGTAKHLNLVHRAYNLQDYGSFGMTELGHGSNVASVETTAVYDHSTREFILNSPTATSAKWWIGAIGKTANMSVIFAQLFVDNINKGVHAFVVPIRKNDASHETFPGVVLGDCGKKIGLEGIDNGFILFKNYRIAYDCLLDKFSSINPEGKFKSAIKNKEKRFGIMIAGLVGGRISCVSGCEQDMRNALTIALRFSAVRKQFSGQEGPELPVLNYPLQRYRLIPYLAKTFATRAGVIYSLGTNINTFFKRLEEDPECLEVNEFHAILSALKVVTSWYGIACLQECREAVGGLGYSSYAQLGRIRNNQDVMATWEGDNSVLIQQAGKFLFKQVQKTFKGQKIQAKTLKFLKTDINEVNLFKPKFENSEQLENEAVIIEIIEYRVNILLHQSLLKLQENTMTSIDMIDAWNKAQVYYIQEVSKAYGELILTNDFLRFVNELAAKDQVLGKIFRKYWLLYSIGVIEKSLVTLMEHVFNATHVKAIRESIMRLCNELAEDSIQVIDALATPDLVLGSVLGVSDGQIYKKMVETVEKGKRVYEKPEWLPLLLKVKGIKN
mmetsp:Transcript_17771/g.17742  ORF Transcript_17771/g.17742 Transcript_17771/m.17742 type:complete len:641 (-) Transcript_17771:42-1964(-)|eukprot:CAMPEP_0202946048 /NCGR_PEP_ID=MMETSP1395-20130829/8243_1 /ASSEMBLY_ACC=CAM_ASM_000871 /TAXON_ID=5961 /ORGANISM="Blepharisma japonicum, Strain Stock R1072" /LENGTH=640 /DNA_ID=CAMNT_0049646411 /DNA_START=161 /DNA_END=2083 /DNA_ORIENTATION=+